MKLSNIISKERKPENEGFRKVTELHERGIPISHNYIIEDIEINVKYDITDIEVFLNPKNNIAYFTSTLKTPETRIVPVPDSEEVKQELEREFNKMFGHQIRAYSICYDGTEILTGNFWGINSEVPNELFINGRLLRNIEGDPDKILKSHKNYVSELEIISDPKLHEKLIDTLANITNYFERSIGISTKIN